MIDTTTIGLAETVEKDVILHKIVKFTIIYKQLF